MITLVPPTGQNDTATLGDGAFTLVPPVQSPVTDPAMDFNPGQRFMMGFGGTVADRILAFKTLLARMQANGALDQIATEQGVPTQDTSAAGQQRLNDLQQQAADKRVTDAPLRATTAGALGGIAADVGTLLPMAGTGMPGAIAGGAVLGALTPTTGDDSTAWNMTKSALAGAGGQLVGDAFGAILRGVKPTEPQLQAAKDFADQWGGLISRGQMAGSELLKRVEGMANAMGSKFGAQAAEANPVAVKTAFDSVTGGDAGALYQKLAPYGFTVDQQLADVAQNAATPFKMLPAAQQPRNALDALQELFAGKPGAPNPMVQGMGPRAQAQLAQQGVPATLGGTAPKLAVGDTLPMVGPKGDYGNYQNMRSLYRSLGLDNTPEGAVYGQLADSLDDAAARSLTAQGMDPATLSQIRNAYSLEKFMRPAAIVDDSGNVTGYDPTKVASIVQQIERKYGSARLYNMGDVGDMMRQAAAFGRTVQPMKSSGTAENQIAGKVAGLELMKDAMGSIMHGGNVFTALLEGLSPLAGAVYAPRAINAIMQATRNGALPDVGGAIGRKAADIAGQLGGSVLRAAPLTLSLGDLLPAAGGASN